MNTNEQYSNWNEKYTGGNQKDNKWGRRMDNELEDRMVEITVEQNKDKRMGGRGWDDLGEWHWNMYNIIYEMSCQASPGSMHDTGCLGLVHWDNPEGWYGEGGGFRMGNTCIPVADACWYMAKPIQYCKVKK